MAGLESITKSIDGVEFGYLKKATSEHLLVRGDCTEILPRLRSESIDLIVTDPPYNIGLDYGGYHIDRMAPPAYFEWARQWLNECARLLSKKGSLYLISYPEINARLLPILEDEGKLKFRRWLTWHYPTNIGHSKKNFTRSQRSILFFTKGQDYTFNRENLTQHYKNPEVKKIIERIRKGHKGRTTYDVLRFLDLIELSRGMIDVLDINLLKNISKDRFNGKHPCQLPLQLLRILIKTSSNPGDIIMDPFAGTFSTTSVSAELRRSSLGIEINPHYLRLGKMRLKGVT